MDTRILIVEDDIISGKLLENIIENLGYKSLGIKLNVEDALIAVRNEKPDIVCMDIELSAKMDGIHIAELVAGSYNIPVIFVTSYSDNATINRAKQIGAGYITKPFFEKDIKDIIAATLERTDHVEKEKQKKDKKNQNVAIKEGDEIKFLNLYDIYYFEADGHKIIIRGSNVSYTMRGSLKKFKEMDDEDRFLRCHKSYLINTEKVDSLLFDKEYNYKVKLKDIGTEVPVSKDKVKYFR